MVTNLKEKSNIITLNGKMFYILSIKYIRISYDVSIRLRNPGFQDLFMKPTISVISANPLSIIYFSIPKSISRDIPGSINEAVPT